MSLEKQTIWQSSKSRQSASTSWVQSRASGPQGNLKLTFLGTFHVALGEHTLTDFKTSKVRALLAYLAVESTRAHERAGLAGLLWPDMPERSALRNLTQTLVRVRHAIRDEEATPPYINATRQTVQLNHHSPYSLDVADFANTLMLYREKGLPPATAGEQSPLATVEMVSHLEQAVSLYKGDLLAGFSLPDSELFDEWLLHKREYLHELAVRGMEQLAEFYMQAGNPEQAQLYAQRQLELDTWREKAHRQLMMAMAQSGHRAAAIAQYEKCREVLRYELDAEPDHATTILLHQIRSGEISTMATQTISIPVVPPPSTSQWPATDTVNSISNVVATPETQPKRTYRHNFSQAPAPIIGRDDIVETVYRSLFDSPSRLVTLVGRGGVGKTRVAQAVATRIIREHRAQSQPQIDSNTFNAVDADSYQKNGASADSPKLAFPDGTWLIQHDQVLTLAQSIGEVLGLTVADVIDLDSRIAQELATRELLLVLDNFEYAMSEIDFLLRLIDSAPGVALLVCSRERLNISHEKQIQLNPLPVPSDAHASDTPEYSSIRLFVESAQLNVNDTINNDHWENIVRICQLVDGLPLGIELAAMQTRHYDYAEIADALEEDLDFLVSMQRDAPPSHKSMRTVFDDSWNLLTTMEQRLLAKASIFAGTFSREAILKITGAQLPELAALVDKSLIEQPIGGRYQLPRLLRQFAAEKATDQASPDRDDSSLYMQRFASYYLESAANVLDRLQTSERRNTLVDVRQDVENLQGLFSWAVENPQSSGPSTDLWSVVELYKMLGLWQDASKCIGQLRTMIRDEENLSAGSGLQLSLGFLLAQDACALSAQQEYSRALALAEQAVRATESARDAYNESWAHYALGQAKYALGDLATARSAFEDAFSGVQEAATSLSQESQPAIEKLQAACLTALAIVATAEGSRISAEEFEERAFQLYLATGDQIGRLRAQIDLGTSFVHAKQYSKAESHLQQALRQAQKIDSIYDQTQAHLYLCQLDSALGLYESGQEHGHHAQELGRKYRDQLSHSQALLLLAKLSSVQGNPTEGLQLSRQALSIADELDNQALRASCKTSEGYALVALKRADEALSTFRDAAFLWKQEGLYHRVANTFVGNAEVYFAKGNHTSAIAQVDQLLKFIQYNSLAQLDDPLAALNISTKILRACKDPRSSEIAALAQQTLEAQKAQIADPMALDSFLVNIATNREVMAGIR